MGRTVTLQLPDTLARRAERAAAGTNSRVEDVLMHWLAGSAAEVPVESLSDDEVLALADSIWPDELSDEFGDLLADQRESRLTPAGRERLDLLTDLYRHGQLRKTQALVVAINRGLRPRLDHVGS